MCFKDGYKQGKQLIIAWNYQIYHYKLPIDSTVLLIEHIFLAVNWHVYRAVYNSCETFTFKNNLNVLSFYIYFYFTATV